MLLTRSPLVYPRRGLTVRLACVKHAAGVRPEPGSNSPLKIFSNTNHPEEQPAHQLSKTTSSTSDRTHCWVNHQSISKEPSPRPPTPKSRQTRHEVSHSAYLALTLSTLLSSQDSLTHRTRLFSSRLGATRNTLVRRFPRVKSSSAPELSPKSPSLPLRRAANWADKSLAGSS